MPRIAAAGLTEEEEVPIDDLIGFELTQEEIELEDNGEEGSAPRHLGVVAEHGEEEGKDNETMSKYGVAMSQVTSGELEPCFAIHPVSSLTTRFGQKEC